MTQTTMTTGIAGRQDLGLLGSRQLLAVQLISIGRLTPHVIPFVPGTFVAISGRGPKGDSNESSKTTALAATSLLLGDSEWRLRGAGSQYAVGLLYDPPGLEHLAHAADQGYVIGLFAQAGEPPTELLTVWMRINRRSPHIEVKVQSGDGLLEFDDGQLVPALADDHWRSMRHIGKGASLGPRFAEALYGTSPRCIAHLTRRGNLKTRNASLLNAAAGGFGAEEIGDELVRLAGRQDILDDDMAQRSLLGAVTDQLKERQREAQDREREYERQLRELDNRDRARGLLRTAQHDWDSHDARRLVDLQDARVEKQTAMDSELDRRSGLDERLAVAESAFAELGDDAQLRRTHDEAVAAMQLAEAAQEQAREALRDARGEADRLRDHALTLRSEADGWTGDLTDAETAARLARDDLTQRERELAVAEADATRAEQALRQCEEGRGDAAATLDRLDAAGVPAVGLLDAVELDLVGQQRIEPLLWPYRDAVVVGQEDIDAALEAVAGIPWAVLISGPADAPSPTGVRSCPVGAGRFLAALAARGTVADDPARVADAELGLSVVAGVEALTGRGARVRSARTRVEMASSALREAADLRARAALMASGADDELRRAQAAAALVEAEEEARRFEDAVNGTTTRLSGADATLRDAREYERELDVTLRGLEAERQRAQEHADVSRQAITDHAMTLSGLWVDLQSLSDSIGLAESAWGRGEQAARERCASEGRDSGTLRNRANIDLHEALYAIGMSRQDDQAMPPWRSGKDVTSPAA
jgi:chromosome segregation protein